MNLLQTIIILLLYYSCVMFSLLLLRVLYFPFYSEVSLDSKLEHIKKKIPKYFLKHIVSDGQIELILKHKCTFI